MDRKDFLKKAGLAAAGLVAAPYILPSGRLFASSGGGMADHVVFVLFAGGVRQQESVLQRYLDDSQGVPIPGNLMYNMVEGAAPTSKIVYGTDGNLAGDTPIPKLLNTSLERQGTYFKEVDAQRVGHYAGLNALVTGNYSYTQGLKQKSSVPTIFEYVRKHLGVPATKAWFVGNGIGNSVPLLNYSTHSDYGADFGANFLAPNLTFGSKGRQHLKDAKVYHPEEELGPMYKMKFFLDQANMLDGRTIPGIKNTDEEKFQMKEFFRTMFDKTANNTLAMPSLADGNLSNDLRTIGYACEVIREFKPNVTVINLNNVDGCHSNFTGYLKALHRSDHGVAHLWNFIQTQVPDMAGNTALVVMPEHGRNLNPNPIIDQNDWNAYDHSDANSKRIFAMMAGPGIPVDLQRGGPGNTIGNAVDSVPTIGEILGIKNSIMSANLVSPSSRSLFDRI